MKGTILSYESNIFHFSLSITVYHH